MVAVVHSFEWSFFDEAQLQISAPDDNYGRTLAMRKKGERRGGEGSEREGGDGMCAKGGAGWAGGSGGGWRRRGGS